VVATMGDLPGEVRDEKEGVGDPSDSIVDKDILRKSAVSCIFLKKKGGEGKT